MIKFTTVRIFTVLLALPFLAVANEVQSFPVRGIDLAHYRTFKMLPTRVLTGAGVLEDDPDFSPLINAALRNELTKKGLKEVADSPDMEVAAGALMVSIPQVQTIIYNLAADAADWGTAPITTIGRYNREGTLIVNLIDPRTKKSVWLGFAKRALGRPSKRQVDINKAASALFKKYPAQP
jgi:hypothetical protein